MNKAVAGLYSPGSTFKMVVALAALEAGYYQRQQSLLFRQNPARQPFVSLLEKKRTRGAECR